MMAPAEVMLLRQLMHFSVKHGDDAHVCTPEYCQQKR